MLWRLSYSAHCSSHLHQNLTLFIWQIRFRDIFSSKIHSRFLIIIFFSLSTYFYFNYSCIICVKLRRKAQKNRNFLYWFSKHKSLNDDNTKTFRVVNNVYWPYSAGIKIIRVNNKIFEIHCMLSIHAFEHFSFFFFALNVIKLPEA